MHGPEGPLHSFFGDQRSYAAASSPRATERDPLLSVRLNLTCFPLWGRQVAAPAVNARTRETIHALAVSNAPQANIDVGAAASSARKAGSRRGDRPW